MRCTRCDGLVVPQAVGIHPDGSVVFGWCLRCLARSDCRLVEIPEAGPLELKLKFKSGGEIPGVKGAAVPLPSSAVDQSQWIIALVSFLMISWGLILVAAGLFSGSRPLSGAGSSGHLTSPLLGIAGAVTAFLGLGLMIVASRRDWLPGTFVLVVLNWLSLASALAILAYAVFDYQPTRNVPILLGTGMALLISIVARLLERSERRKPRTMPLTSSWKPAALVDWAQAGATKRLH
jgi:hypothetical protein